MRSVHGRGHEEKQAGWGDAVERADGLNVEDAGRQRSAFTGYSWLESLLVEVMIVQGQSY